MCFLIRNGIYNMIDLDAEEQKKQHTRQLNLEHYIIQHGWKQASNFRFPPEQEIKPKTEFHKSRSSSKRDCQCNLI